jgi:hypothetical protein
MTFASCDNNQQPGYIGIVGIRNNGRGLPPEATSPQTAAHNGGKWHEFSCSRLSQLAALGKK